MEKELNLFLEPINEIEKYPIDGKGILSLKKGEILELASKIIQDVNDGLTDSIDVLIISKKIELFMDALKAGLDGNVVLTQSKDFHKHGAVLNEQFMGVKYDYSVCGHNEYNHLKPQQEAINARLKEIEGQIKKSKDGFIVDKETGEAIEVKPPLKTGKNTIVVKIIE